MVPPRLSIVTDAARDDAEEPAPAGPGPAEVAHGAGNLTGLSSPVHELIASIETGSVELRQAGDNDGTAPESEPAASIPETPTPHDAEAASAAEMQAVAAAPPAEAVRLLEAVLFAASEPLAEDRLALNLPAGTDVGAVLAEIQTLYAGRGVSLVKVADKWAFRTAEDLSWAMERHASEERRLSKAALETLAIVAYHQPVTRAEIEEIRGVTISKGTLDVLMETGWVRPRGRRRAPGKPVTYGTTEAFLAHFSLETVKDLPGLSELKGAGLLDANLPPDFKVPEPTDTAALMPDELPLDSGADEDEVEQAELAFDEIDEIDEDGLDQDDIGEPGPSDGATSSS